MICYVLAMGKHHLGPHVVVGYRIKIFWPGLSITTPDRLVSPVHVTEKIPHYLHVLVLLWTIHCVSF